MQSMNKRFLVNFYCRSFLFEREVIESEQKTIVMCNGISDVFTLMPCAAFAEETSAEGQVESLEAERPAEDDAFGEGGLDEAFFAEDADSLIGTLEANEESAACGFC